MLLTAFYTDARTEEVQTEKYCPLGGLPKQNYKPNSVKNESYGCPDIISSMSARVGGQADHAESGARQTAANVRSGASSECAADAGTAVV